MINIDLSINMNEVDKQYVFDMLKEIIVYNRFIVILIIMLLISVVVYAILSVVLDYEYKMKKIDNEKEFMNKYLKKNVNSSY